MKTARNMDNLPSPSEADSLIAQKMASLSMKDREDFLFDLHGVQKAVPETPEMIQTSLQQLDFEMEQVNSKEAYEMAIAMNPDYVDNLRLRFLRAERFHTPKAALRFSRFFEQKLKLFGKEKLGRDIIQDDLDEHTLKVIHSNQNQTVGVRDRAGRAVGIFFPSLAPSVLREKECLAKVMKPTLVIEDMCCYLLSYGAFVSFLEAARRILLQPSYFRGRGDAEKWHGQNLLCRRNIRRSILE